MTDINTAELRRLAENAEEARKQHRSIVPTSLYQFQDAATPQTVIDVLDRLEAAEAAIERVRGEVEEVQREHMVMPPDALILADRVLAALAPVTEGGEQ